MYIFDVQIRGVILVMSDISAADPGFPVGGGGRRPIRGADIRRGRFLAETYAKTKELEPGGRWRRPLDPPLYMTIIPSFGNFILCSVDNGKFHIFLEENIKLFITTFFDVSNLFSCFNSHVCKDFKTSNQNKKYQSFY